jgi:predicted P-loop ATPase
VAKVFVQAQNFTLVLDGNQDIGKSFWARWLCPLQDLFFEGPIQPDNNDHQLRLIRNWMWEIRELASTTRKADQDALKGFLTTKVVTARRPWGRHDLVKPALASFIGTINESGAGFLNDSTGSRRFVIVKLAAIDWTYTKLDLDQVWAEAYIAYQNGESYQLSASEKRTQAEINAEYDTLSTVEQHLWACFEIDSTNATWITAQEILAVLEQRGLSGFQNANLGELGRILKIYEPQGVVRGRPRLGSAKPTAYTGLKQIWP